ncbi:hypothetical protein [Parasulfitobacter algicola]|uniref:Uncharacterized protein n=1 Tax=Parasulfitobacter algicola TaxID=2614809 RepID=A0ABX2IT68_9RHOB|nr:hypothetical protein [Sulfitobacter algicola]NSX53258.1 hypothetical protein [Sulfitobacter algicola]
MFRLIRLLIFTAAAFVAGIVYQMVQHSEKCSQAGGEVVRGICTGENR